MTYSPAPAALKTFLAIGFAAPLWLAACGQAPEAENDGTPANVIPTHRASEMVKADTAAAVPLAPTNLAIAPVDAAVSDPTGLTPEAMKGEKGARAVLLDWARSLETGDWAKARAQWGHDGMDSGLSPEDFALTYRKYRSISVAIGDGDVEGGAGSLYYEVPVTIFGTLRDGRTARLAGPVTLRRVNDVDGASAADLRWHITQSGLKPRP